MIVMVPLSAAHDKCRDPVEGAEARGASVGGVRHSLWQLWHSEGKVEGEYGEGARGEWGGEGGERKEVMKEGRGRGDRRKRWSGIGTGWATGREEGNDEVRKGGGGDRRRKR